MRFFFRDLIDVETYIVQKERRSTSNSISMVTIDEDYFELGLAVNSLFFSFFSEMLEIQCFLNVFYYHSVVKKRLN